ncbi:hypothetical protein [Mariprofundus ferrooxydans]|uniref:hypothetical protein n=1 Tax=Mariprofundus ferrooxydans TaxID=314344 RepID=UPI001E42D315|nr:hypothetical protein [Mariprofundus ferrooxydans]
MKLATSRILVQLSDQERSDIERELTELNERLQRMQQQQGQTSQHIQQLDRQRDQIMKQHNNSALLQNLNACMSEQQQLLSITNAAIAELAQLKHEVLDRMKTACRTKHSYEAAHHKEKHRLQRKQEQQTQRELDDLVGRRAAADRAAGNA